MTTTNISYGTSTDLTVTSLNSLANSATVGWQSELIDNRTTKAVDYLIECKFPMSAVAAASDKTMYLYVAPAYYDGTTWFYPDGGTATLPSGSAGSYVISTSLNNLTLLRAFNYVTTSQIIQGTCALSQTFGTTMPHGFSFIVVNFTGAAITASGAKIAITPVTYTSA